MSICPVCGCKTDELDFVLCTIEKNEEMVCSFCEKQIKKLYSDEEPGAAQIRWLTSVIDKDVPARDQNVLSALCAMKNKFAPEKAEVKAPDMINQFADIKRDVNIPQTQTKGTSEISVEQYNSLVNRLEKLEKSFAKYKKAQLMKMVIELLVPVVMAIIIAIIFFSSGLFDLLSTLSSR